MNSLNIKIVACVAALLGLSAFSATAASVRVQCEQRGQSRSSASVDGKDLPALPAGQTYRAAIVSGGNSASSKGEALVGGEVEFDFDSNPKDIAAGATAIPATFIVGGQLTGKILRPDGSTLVLDTVACRVRSR